MPKRCKTAGNIFNILKEETKPLNKAIPEMRETARRLIIVGRSHYPGWIKKELKKSQKSLISNHILLQNSGDEIEELIPSIKWITENYYIISRESREVKEQMRKIKGKIPIVYDMFDRITPRICMAVREIMSMTGCHFYEERLKILLEAYQNVSPFSIYELWMIPVMLKACYIEEIADIAHNAACFAERKKEAKLFMKTIFDQTDDKDTIMRETISALADHEHSTETVFLSQLIYLLRERGIYDSSFLDSIVKSAHKKFSSHLALIREESKMQTELASKASVLIDGLTKVSEVEWLEFVEQICVVDEILSKESCDVYSRMDHETRDMYRKKVEALAALSKQEEFYVAKKVFDLTLGKEAKPSHVGYYLIDKGQEELNDALDINFGFFGKIKRHIKKHAQTIYFSVILLFSLCLTAAAAYYSHINSKYHPLIFLLMLPVFYIISFNFISEITGYIFAKFLSRKRPPGMNYEKGIPEENMTIAVVPIIVSSKEDVDRCIKKMEETYLANFDANIRVALLADPADNGTRIHPDDEMVYEYAKEETAKLNKKYASEHHMLFFYFTRYRKWNEKENAWMAWERKRGKLEEFNRLLLGDDQNSFLPIDGIEQIQGSIKYVITIDQDTDLVRGSARKLVGIMAHILNEPVFDEGKRRIVEGYALIQPRIDTRLEAYIKSPFTKLFAGRVGIDPYAYAAFDIYQDLFSEGTFVGKGIYDLRFFSKALDGMIPENAVLSHDLIEGCYAKSGLASDIQLADGHPSNILSFYKREHRWIRGDWQLLPWILGKDKLSFLSRWKMLTNLIRSLDPAAYMIYLILLPILFNWHTVIFLSLMIISIILSLLPIFTTDLVDTFNRTNMVYTIRSFFSSISKTLFQIVFIFSILPYKAYIAADAIIRTIWRLTISKKRMLNWITAEHVEKKHKGGIAQYLHDMYQTIIIGIACVLAGIYLEIVILITFGLIFLAAPCVSYFIGRPYKKKRKRLKQKDINELYDLARKTWRYFEEFYTAEYNCLIPDNFQVLDEEVTALRTSPTNIGLQLMAFMSARDFGFISLNGFLDMTERTIDTVRKLKKWHGNLYNWYDIMTLQPLLPNYVSSVDSGNFVSYVVALKQGILDELQRPIFSVNNLKGIKDVLAEAGFEKVEFDVQSIEINKISEFIKDAIFEIDDKNNAWINREYSDCARNSMLSYLQDLEGLDSPDVSVLDLCDQNDRGALMIRERILELVRRLERIIKNTRLNLLYDTKKNLFSIGYNVTKREPDRSYYDLLASEARITSFLAIAKGEIPSKHWYKMARPLSIVASLPVLISWNGTMFEYFMPHLLLDYYPKTIFNFTLKGVVKAQIKYAEKMNTPYGISESAYYRFDHNLNYQYRAFGVPGLGLKADLSKFHVIAPYASLMTLEIYPEKVIKNIERLKQIGAYGRFGFYDSIDYISPENVGFKSPRIIRTFMCHHQGMILVSLDNFLHDQVHRKRFHKEPMIRASQFMLEETKLLGKVHKDKTVSRSGEKSVLPEDERSRARIIRDVHMNYPVTHVMSNDKYQIVIDSNGTGYSKFDRSIINFWDGDWTSNQYANCIYVKNQNTGKYYTTTYKPSMVEPDSYEVLFYPEKAEFTRVDDDISVKTEIIAMADYDGEIRRVTLSNKSRSKVRLELTGYMDVILDKAASYMGHPAFSKLFIETEYDAHYKCVIATRRQRDEETGLSVGVSCIKEGRDETAFEYNTSRADFRGRGRSLAYPHAMDDSYQFGRITGEVVDPCIALRTTIELGVGESRAVSFVYVVSENEKELGPCIESFRTEDVIQDKFVKAYYDNRIEMSYLGLNYARANAILEAAACIIYPLDVLKGDKDTIEKNILSQKHLWRFGISGDNSMILVLAKDLSDLDAVKDSVLIYEYMRRNQLEVDLVVINQQNEGYNRELTLAISDVLEDVKSFESDKKIKGVFELSGDDVSDEELSLITTCADIVLKGDDRILGTRIRDSRKKIDFSSTRSITVHDDLIEYPEKSLKVKTLRYFNGYGGFDTDKDEYSIILDNWKTTPMPWINIIANEKFGCLTSESGMEYTYFNNSRENKITKWSNDPIANDLPEIVYVSDSLTNQVFTITSLPVRTQGEYVIKHGHGHTIYEFNYQSLIMDQMVFVPADKNFKYVIISVKNISKHKRTLCLGYYADLVLGPDKSTGMKHIITKSDEKTGILTAVNRYNDTYSNSVTYMGCDTKILDYTCDKKEFMGYEERKDMPPGMVKTKLSKKTGLTLNPCFSQRANIVLKPGENKQIVFMLGQEDGAERINELVNEYCNINAAAKELAKLSKAWKKKLSVLRVNTPDEKMNLMLNDWLLVQTISSRIYAKAAYYQAGGAIGFRDQLQDCMSLFYCMPDKARETIINAASRQFVEGDVMHWWHEDTNAGIRTKISDDLLWLPYVLCAYIQTTGDISILDEKTPYLIYDKLADDEYEKYCLPKVSDKKASVYEHAKKAIQYSHKFGEHGLPLMGSGDWNDGMNRIGHKGRGESVWLGWFLYTVMEDFKILAQEKEDGELIGELERVQNQLKSKLDQNAWDGQWYLRAFFDDGTKVGSREQAECKIDLISQVWSVISEAGDDEKAGTAMESVKKYLLDENEKMLTVLTPPFRRSRPTPGYIQGYLRGVRENGGQYTHAAIWAIYAFAKMGDNQMAYRLFDMINPISHTESSFDVQKYMLEPYAVAADVYYNNLQKGRGGWSFYTGSAAWLYRAGVEELFGFKKRGNRVFIDPSLPDDFDYYSIEYEYGRTKYTIHVERSRKYTSIKYIINEEETEEKHIELIDDNNDRIVRVLIPI